MPFAFMNPLFLLSWLLIPVIWLMAGRSPLKRQGRRRQLLIAGLRSLLLFLLGLGLSDPRVIKGSDRVNVMFCLDVSESIARDEEKRALAMMQRAATGMRGEDRAGLVIFGEQPSLEIALKKDFGSLPIKSRVNTNFTNLYKTLQLTIGKLTQEGTNRIVLFSDGNQNMEDAVDMAYLARSLGIEIYSLPMTPWSKMDDIFIESLTTSPSVPLETPFDISLVITSTKETVGELVLLRNERLMTVQDVHLQSGKNIFRFADTLEEQGLYLYRAVINTPDDALFQNNEGLSFTQGTRKSEVLYLAEEEGKPDHLARALESQGLRVVRKRIEDVPHSIHGLLDYSAIVLDNVSGRALPFTMMEHIEKYVKDMGGGLIMIGGDRSFGAGHYLKTPIENALPVFMDVPTELELQGFCLILVLDKSQSMSGDIAGKRKLEAAKIAAFSSVEMLNPMDSVGILAFDSEFQWVVPITPANERRKIARQLSTLEADGGTDLYSGLKESFRVLKDIPAAKKHVIILSDGLTVEADFHPLVRSMKEARITISTVSVGRDSDRILMRSIAEWGGGRGYYTDNAQNIPRIFVGETKIAAKKVIVEKAIRPFAVMPADLVQGIPTDDLPSVNGLVITYPKPGARVLIDTEEGPLLVAGPYGLGRSVAFTSDLSGRWGKDWVLWDHYGKFVSQMVKWVQRKQAPRNYTADISRKGGTGTFIVDVIDDRNRFVNNLSLNIKVLLPSKNTQTIVLDQVAPGRYRGPFPAKETGEYYLSLFGKETKEFSLYQHFGFGVPYSDEFTVRDADLTLLKRLASITNGRILEAEDDLEELFRAQADTNAYGRPLWPYLVMASLILLLMDVGVRKFQSLG